MNKIEIEERILDLKVEYMQIQHNLEKLEFIKGNLTPLENRLSQVEEELSSLRESLLKTING